MFYTSSFVNITHTKTVWVCQSSSSESEEEEEEEVILTDEEMNKLGAKLVKAELMGNTVSSLKHFWKPCDLDIAQKSCLSRKSL